MMLLSTALAGAAAAVAALVPSSADQAMHEWCEDIGLVVNPSVKLITTPESVAGRGVFAMEPLNRDDSIASIPTYSIFHAQNAGNVFPDRAEQIGERMKKCSAPSVEKKRHRVGRFLTRLFRKNRKQEMDWNFLAGEERPWQAELTEYALAALQDEHPLAPWIQQWQRDDPVHHLFEKGVSWQDQEAIDRTAKELHEMVPDLPLYKILAAVHIRLEQYQQFKKLLSDPESVPTAAMYSTLCSRTLGVTDTITGVVPFHDMINHSFEPNLCLEFSKDGRYLELLALKDISPGEELFLCYTTVGREYDEDAAVWMLVQWGIPVTRDEWKVSKICESNDDTAKEKTPQ